LVIGEDGFYAEDNNGAQRSGRDPIDLESLFAFLTATDRLELPLPHGTKMGHVHLHVRDVNEAVQFWSDIVGFDLMGKSNRFGAAFVSAGGYHHHLGLNTWAGEARHQHPWVRLDFVTSRLRPTKVDLDFVGNRLRTAGVEITDETESMFLTEDPSGDRVRITVRE